MTANHRAIELLAPAKTADIGIEAILHGADAVYIGAPRYGARSAAGCTADDIARLCDFAHTYDARVYVALNTILYDKELSDAEKIAHAMYRAGADALIVQDMSLLKLDLPPIPLHASTQCDNRTPERVKFLSDCGFSQVVLARELSLEEIRKIASRTDVPLEVFVHGALCVSYSGQCYLSAALTGRSANRGECAQCCRLPYTLSDGAGRVVARNCHLLSLKDLNQSSRLEELLDAGASSLKIEGRLKDAAYVKNITAYYRAQLDDVLKRRGDTYRRASAGVSAIGFVPDPYKSFNRGFTHYFLDGRSDKPIIQPATPKSIGEPVGEVQSVVDNRTFRYKGSVELHNGDGLCYIDKTGLFQGFRLNRVDGNLLHVAASQHLTAGTPLFRNKDSQFEMSLARPTAQRYIPVKIAFRELPDGFALAIADGTLEIVHRCPSEKVEAKVAQQERQKQELAKLGNTPYRAESVSIELSGEFFIPPSRLALWRREAIEWFMRARRMSYRRERRKPVVRNPEWNMTQVDYRANIANRLADSFFHEHGVGVTAPAFEIAPVKDGELMRSRHCIRHFLGVCLKTPQGKHLPDPLTMTHGDICLELHFDCARCEMVVCQKRL